MEFVCLVPQILVVLAWRMLCFVAWRFVLEVVPVDLVWGVGWGLWVLGRGQRGMWSAERLVVVVVVGAALLLF